MFAAVVAVADIHSILPAAWFAQKRLVDSFNGGVAAILFAVPLTVCIFDSA